MRVAARVVEQRMNADTSDRPAMLPGDVALRVWAVGALWIRNPKKEQRKA